jgi:hypothetical protein
MRLNLIAAAALLAAAPAFSAVAPGTTGNGELVLVIADSTAKVSFALDTGWRINDFVTDVPAAPVFVGNVAGFARSAADSSADASWASFLTTTSGHVLTWAVFANDSTGANALVNGLRLLATVRDTQTGLTGSLTNAAFTNGIAATQMGTFFNALNGTATQIVGGATNYAYNGTSVNADPNAGYFGHAGGTSSTINGNSPFNITNTVVFGGTSTAPFYAFTRSGSNQLGTVINTPFAAPMTLKVAADGSNFVLGYSVPVPEAETFALMAAGLAAIGFVARRRKVVGA